MIVVGEKIGGRDGIGPPTPGFSVLAAWSGKSGEDRRGIEGFPGDLVPSDSNSRVGFHWTSWDRLGPRRAKSWAKCRSVERSTRQARQRQLRRPARLGREEDGHFRLTRFIVLSVFSLTGRG